MPMKALSVLMILFVISCAGTVETEDHWQGMTPAEYADMLMDKPPEEKKATSLSQSEKEVLMQMLEAGAAVGGAVITGTFNDGLLYKVFK